MESKDKKTLFEMDWKSSRLGEEKFEFRCSKCGRLLYRLVIDDGFCSIECKCSKCNHLNYFGYGE